MNVAILSESPADEAAVTVLVEAVLGRSVNRAPLPPRSGGWVPVLGALPEVLLNLHYQRKAEGLVVVLDSNSSPVHDAGPEEDCSWPDDCRMCRVRKRLAAVRRNLRPVAHYGPVKVAIGLAVPAMEAWYLCGVDPNVSENAWVQGMRQGLRPYTKLALKQRVYGAARFDLAHETRRARQEMTRVVQDLDALERKFPVGFGCLRRALAAW